MQVVLPAGDDAFEIVSDMTYRSISTSICAKKRPYQWHRYSGGYPYILITHSSDDLLYFAETFRVDIDRKHDIFVLALQYRYPDISGFIRYRYQLANKNTLPPYGHR